TGRYDDATPVTAAGAGVAGAGGIGAVAAGVRGGGDGDGSSVRCLSIGTPVGRALDWEGADSEVRCSVRRAPGGCSASVTAKRAEPKTTSMTKLTRRTRRPRLSRGVPD